jgi:hypothetical protein
MSHQGYQPLSTKDVVFVEGLAHSDAVLFKSDATLRVKDLLSKIEAICTASGQLSAAEVTLLFGHGIDCELLRPGATDWQQGCLQFSIGFQAEVAAPPAAIPAGVLPTPSAAIAAPPLPAPPPIAIKTPAPEVAKVPAPIAVKTPAPMVFDRPEAIAAPVPKAATVSPAIPLPAPQNAVVAAPSHTSTVVLNRPVDQTPELDLASFANVTRPGQPIQDELEIDHSDVFSLMAAATDVTPLNDDFTFSEELEDIEALNFDPTPNPKSISSPWDLEELDGMLMIK